MVGIENTRTGFGSVLVQLIPEPNPDPNRPEPRTEVEVNYKNTPAYIYTHVLRFSFSPTSHFSDLSEGQREAANGDFRSDLSLSLSRSLPLTSCRQSSSSPPRLLPSIILTPLAESPSIIITPGTPVVVHHHQFEEVKKELMLSLQPSSLRSSARTEVHRNRNF
ncbi:hypothetical protein RHMOL_Rhmol04G0176600 [Rhododendron molle]|uniref:Uncharacterized protein n=1 Tax=Rhododendron molle TaxID=49168 RepID=A0ACC0P1F6_RHOML|nr:hypothetical protein RHMOL_Rhmol04G0176600 [Rhododendron molle]